MYRSILIVEDDYLTAQTLGLHLRQIVDCIQFAEDGVHGLRRALADPWDLIILDLILPRLDGLELCARLRHRRVFTPILILSSRSSETDRVRGLDAGADDYLVKPFAMQELQARVTAQLRRAIYSQFATLDSGPEALSVGDLHIDRGSREVHIAGQRIALTQREFDLLAYLAARPDHVFARAELLDNVWGSGYEGYEHTVNSHINRLRAKIENNPSNPQRLKTVWGVGYKLCAATQAP